MPQEFIDKAILLIR